MMRIHKRIGDFLVWIMVWSRWFEGLSVRSELQTWIFLGRMILRCCSVKLLTITSHSSSRHIVLWSFQLAPNSTQMIISTHLGLFAEFPLGPLDLRGWFDLWNCSFTLETNWSWMWIDLSLHVWNWFLLRFREMMPTCYRTSSPIS